MKRELIITFSFLVILLTIRIANSQENQRKIFSKPLELQFENENKFSRLPVDIGKYSPLPYPYTNINISGDTFPQNEPSVKFNAKYPNKVVAAWRDFRTGVSPTIRRIGYTYSTNGGISWAQSNLLPILSSNHPKASDPVVVSDLDGNFYIATISISNTGSLDILVFKSTDGGITFPLYYFAQGGAPHLEDKEWMVCDLSNTSPYKNSLYISWTRFFGGNTPHIMVTKSTNGGMNWSTAVQLTNTTSDVQGSCPAVGPGGELYVVWGEFTSTQNIIKFSKSTNGGYNFTAPTSLTQGETPFIPISSSNLSIPSIACDISGGQRNGWVYTVLCDSRNGDPDIFMTRSTNQGNNWSAPIRVNNDAIGNGKLQCWPWISVNDSGNIAILFYDARNTPVNTAVEAWIARSTDGGTSFINEKISSTPFASGEPNQDVRFGDYICVDYHNKRIVPVWTDMRTGAYNQEIYSANIDLSVGINQMSANIPNKTDLLQNYPNPFNPSTNIKFQLSEPGFVSLKVYNVMGKEISTLINGKMKAGIYETQYTAIHQSSGVYFYSLSINNSIISTKSMMLIK